MVKRVQIWILTLGRSTKEGGAQPRVNSDLVIVQRTVLSTLLSVVDVDTPLLIKDGSVQLGMPSVTSAPNVATSRQPVRRLTKVGELHIASPTESNSSTESDGYMGDLTGGNSNLSSCQWAVTLFLNGKPSEFETDTGAQVTVISLKAHGDIVFAHLRRPQ